MTLYDFEVNSITGEKISLNQYAKKTLLIVNTATECGFSYQLEGFQKLFEIYESQGFSVLAFPSNSFKQEPNDNAEIHNKCSALFKLTFPFFEKIEVKGDNIHPLFAWLTEQKRGFITKAIKGNYTKFLIDQNGQVLKRYAPRTKPESIEMDIKKLLA